MTRTIRTEPLPGQLLPSQHDAARVTLRRYANECLSPAELAVEIERWEQHRELLAGDLKAKDFALFDRATTRAGIAYADQRLAELAHQAQRLLRTGRAATTLDLQPDFDRARDVDLVALIETLTGQPVRRHGGRHVTVCPFHTGDRTPSLTIYGPGKGWHCFGCGRGGQDAASFCAEFFGCSQLEGLRWVEQLCGLRKAA
jgi:hypothetical protein